MSRFLLSLLLLAGVPGAVQAARSYDNCTGFVESLPATITTPGTWCLRGNLATPQVSGAAVTIAANNVVLDCNDFRIDSTATTTASYATGATTPGSSSHHVTVRHCAINGFRYGVGLSGDSHLVEHNTITASLYVGVSTYGVGNVVRNNLVRDTGNGFFPTVYGISVMGGEGVASDNTVMSVDGGQPGAQGGTYAYGIQLQRGIVQGNRLLDIVFIGVGIQAYERSFVIDNLVRGNSPESGIGINAYDSVCRGNLITGWEFNDAVCRTL